MIEVHGFWLLMDKMSSSYDGKHFVHNTILQNLNRDCIENSGK